MKTIGVIVIAFAMLIALTGVVMADQVVPPVPEIQGITSAVSINCEGTVMNSAALGWKLADMDYYDEGLAARGVGIDGIHMLDPTGIEYSTTYDANTIAKAGQTTFIKQTAVSTGGKLLGQSNVKTLTETAFMATGDGGNILGTENIMIDGAGMPTPAADRMLCPFGDGAGNVIPAYCNIAMAGSKYDLVIGSVVSNADERFVGTDATLPVQLNYGINVKPYTIMGQGTSPAMGSASSYFKVSIKEGRTGYWNNTSAYSVPAKVGTYPSSGHPSYNQLAWADVANAMAYEDMDGIAIGPQNEDVTYSESSSASGIINSFSTTYAYQSGKALIP